MALATSLAVGVAVVLAAVVAYVAVRSELRGQVDEQLSGQAELVERAQFRFRGMGRGFGGPPPGFPELPARRGGSADYIQFVSEGRPGFADAELDGEHVRVLTVPLDRGGAIQLARSLESTDDVLARLRWVLLALVLGGVALAAVLGRLAARHLVAPVVRVSEAARHIAETEDLGRRIEVTSEDEVGELAARFNAMLDTLEGSIAAQRQLVADASHELRTPVTSLRTNIEVLAENRLDGAERARLVADVQAQSEELSALVGDLIELARGDQPSLVREDVRLDALVAEAVERARRHAPGVTFETSLEPAVVDGVPDRLARAVNNLLDNAARHGRTVTVSCDPSGVRVRDDGGGIAPEDLPHIFDRFYRGADARGRPGTGLGLAIVRQVAEQHGGVATATNVGGGAEFELRLGHEPAHQGDGVVV
ncbi:MAG TPA: HAMP domain-containing sensor histidine kinase [Solirubrobacteraceae bacterium]|nr:HAMP domain-containing sensor histidine kinase [Solirubrobacteraceae bacterium]